MSHKIQPPSTFGASDVIQSASVDWVTCTFRGENDRARARLIAAELLDRQAVAGWDESGCGYGNYAGVARGPVSWGDRPEDSLVRLSSTAAAENWHRLVPLAATVSRLDLQVTTEDRVPRPGLVSELFSHVQSPSGMRGRPVYSRMVADSNSSSTLYVGSRQSDRYLRLYDKGIEEGIAPPGTIFRTEVEYKGKRAMATARELLHRELEAGPIIGTVRTEAERRRCSIIPSHSDEGVVVASFENASTDEKRLRWMRSQVGPSVQRLISSGKREAVLEALGLVDCNNSGSK